MNVANIVGSKYGWENGFHHRVLSNDPINGVIASGYARKDQKQGHHVDFTPKEYHGLLVLSGTGCYEVGEKKILLKSGDFVQRIPDVTHTTKVTSDDWSEIFVVLGRSLYESLVSMQVFFNQSPVLSPGLNYETIQMFLQFHDQLGYVDRLQLPLIVPQIIQYLVRIQYIDRMNQPSSEEQNMLALATKYIHENLNHRITVEDVAGYVNVGYEKFRKTFTTHYGVSPGNFMINQRVNRAKRLLTNSQLTIKEIAIQLGYVDTYTFSKQFKKITGRNPSEFKELYTKH